jgi:hypothetical protein
MVVNLPGQRVEVICPGCGQTTSFTDVIVSAMAVPPNPARRVVG